LTTHLVSFFLSFFFLIIEMAPTTVLLVPTKRSQWHALALAWARAATRPWPLASRFGIIGVTLCWIAMLFRRSLWNDLSGRMLGIPHPAVNTRDVALYQPFRNALKLLKQLVRLPTLTFHLMGRRCRESQQNPLENARGYGPLPLSRH